MGLSIKEIDELYTPNTSLRGFLYRMVSKFYTITDDFMNQYSDNLDYMNLVLNSHSSMLFKEIVKIYMGVGYYDEPIKSLKDFFYDKTTNQQNKCCITEIHRIYCILSTKDSQKLYEWLMSSDFEWQSGNYRIRPINKEEGEHFKIRFINKIMKLWNGESPLRYSKEKHLRLIKKNSFLQGLLPLPTNVLSDERFYWNWSLISENPNIIWDIDSINQFSDKLNWCKISLNDRLPWSNKLIYEFDKSWDFDSLSRNSSIKWDIDLLQKYGDKVDWNSLSHRNDLNWTFSLLKSFEKKWDFHALSQNQSLPWNEAIIQDFRDRWDWFELSRNTSVKWNLDLIKKCEDKLCFSNLIGWLELGDDNHEFINLFKTKIHWESIHHFSDGLKKTANEWLQIFNQYNYIHRDAHFTIDLKIIDANPSILNWNDLCFSPPQPPFFKFINKFRFYSHLPDIRSDYDYAMHAIFEEDRFVIYENKNKILWTKELLEKYVNRLNWDLLSYNKDLPWSKELLQAFEYKRKNEFLLRRLSHEEKEKLNSRFEHKWNWNYISGNPAIKFDIDIITEFQDKINWKIFSGLEGTFWTEDIIDRFKDKFIWKLPSISSMFLLNNDSETNECGTSQTIYYDFSTTPTAPIDTCTLSLNKSLPWSVEFILKYQDYWDWNQLSRNQGIPWSEQLFSSLKPFLKRKALLSNERFFANCILPELTNSRLSNIFSKDTKLIPIIIEDNYLLDVDYNSDVYEIKSKLKFGKYKGHTLIDVINKDISYIIWCIKNVDSFYLGSDVIDLLDDKIYDFLSSEVLIEHYENALNSKPYMWANVRKYYEEEWVNNLYFPEDNYDQLESPWY